jgi:uncharacterized membrane-anchored protein
MNHRLTWRRPLRLLAAWLLPLSVLATPQAPDPAVAAAQAAAVLGPQDVRLDAQAVLHLPAGHRFVPQPQAAGLLRAMGNPGEHAAVRGLVFPTADNADWFALISWEGSGYIKDDDAKDWNVDELLKSYRDGTEAQNEERRKMGMPELEIVGWAERPAYDAASHRLVWAMSSRHKGEAAGAAQGVNYNTYALGREGYLSLNLVTGLADLPAHKPAAQQLLAALEFNEGKRYADFQAGTDRVAEYGLAALVLGAGAKKLGFFALAGAFLLKFAKLFLIGGIAVLGGLMKFFKRDKAQA